MSTEPAGWPEGWDRIVLDETDSTNAHAARLAETVTRPTWILALHQTAGRGRRGRPWAMPAGNFAATLLMVAQDPPQDAALRSFVAALALRDALRDLTRDTAALALKWPNDVLLNGGKVAGILLEGSVTKAGRRYLATGIGVNLVAVPDAAALLPGAATPVSVAGETGLTLAPETLLDALAVAYAARERQFLSGGFAATRRDWMAHAARIGEVITARTMSETITGTFVTLGHDGALVLSDDKGSWRSIPAADIYF